jgi:hypothetical protein
MNPAGRASASTLCDDNSATLMALMSRPFWLSTGASRLPLIADGHEDRAGRRRVGIGAIARRGQAELSLPADLAEQLVAFPGDGEDRRAAQ